MKRLLFALAWCYAIGVQAAPVKSDFPWQPWGDAVFERAAKENKFVLLSLQAWWCHPCHQMNTITYDDPSVRGILADKFIPVYVDQDSRPDISQRYERWGWPATIIFAADGTEIVKLKGFYSPKFFIPILQATIEDPSPVDYGRIGGPERAASQITSLTDAQRKVIVDFMNKMYDEENGGWGRNSKFTHGPTYVYALEQSARGEFDETRARQTIDGLIGMIDADNGGMSQISLSMDWDRALPEFPMFAQEAGLETFSLAYALWGEQRHLDAAQRIVGFLDDTMRASDGGFYTSTGSHNFEPGVDRRRYARENGQAIRALAQLHDFSGDADALRLAEQQARWVLANRRLDSGGFRHDDVDSGGPYLVDSLAMAQALLALYRSTAQREWLQRAIETGDFIAANFIDDDTGGFLAAARPAHRFLAKAVKHKDENVRATRFFNLLHYYSGDQRYREIARGSMGYLTSDHVLDAYWFAPGVLQAEFELAREPTHITVVGAKDDPAAAELFRSALAYPTVYKRVEWWDKREGPLPHDNVTYPSLDRAAAFACSASVCSTPVFKSAQVAEAVRRLDL
jgi:uncharacterized protein YyaL (SSP411 family)